MSPPAGNHAPDMRSLARLAAVLAMMLTAGLAQARPAALVIDARTGQVLHAQDATQPWYPASLAKMMTIYVALEAAEGGETALDTKLTVSANAAAQMPVKLYLRAGDVLTVKEAIVALITRSANDVAVALAEHLAGTEEAFAERMTATAERLGMGSTVFANASGLPHPDNATTARDMALLARALMTDFPQHFHFFGARGFAWKGRTLPTINGIVVSYQGADGLKTGFTCGSGYNLVASAERDGRRVIAVLLGARSRDGRRAEMVGLLDRAWKADAGEQTLENLERAEGAGNAPAHLLKSDECARGVASVGPGGTVPAGWAVTLGGFADAGKARAAITRAKGMSGGGLTGGRAVILATRGKNRATVAGLGERDAIGACAVLRRKGQYCLVMPPKNVRAAVK